MKKNLLTLSLVVASMTAYSQTEQHTYIGTKAVVKVQPNTLFYNGGNLQMVDNRTNTATDNVVVKNSGNIQVQGNYLNTIPTTDGKVFINEWNDVNDYGQLIINEAKTTTGKVAMERKLPNINGIDEYIIALPFQGETAENIYNSITNFSLTNPNNLVKSFSGNCPVNQNCYGRHQQSMFVWDNSETEYDPVLAGTIIEPTQRYLLNTRGNSNLRQVIQTILTNSSEGNEKESISFAGTPANKYEINLRENNLPVVKHELTLKSGLKKDINGNSFYHDALNWQNWKNNRNHYSETYDSYLGNQSTNNNSNKLFGKNIHRLANPFTSNLDISDISTNNSWITFKLSTVGEYVYPAEAFKTAIRFNVYKIANDFKITWNSDIGNTSVAEQSTLFSAQMNQVEGTDNFFWVGSAEALLVRPYETFFIDYYLLNPTNNQNGSRIVDAKVKFGDKHKTFKKDYTTISNPSNPGQISGIFSRGNLNTTLSDLQNDEDLKARGLVTDFDFTQLELYLSENNSLKGSAAYLLNANFMTTGNEVSSKTANNPVFFYEETTSGEVAVNAENVKNYFNSEDYIGKPLRVGFKNLVIGNEYQLNLNLYEYSILNKVDNLSLGRYYLLDKQNNSITEVDAMTQVRFTADENSNNRFEFYWNEEPRTLSTIDINKNATYIYKDKQQQFVRFEDKNTTATIEIFDITGRAIHKSDKVNTSVDYKLNLTNVPTVYVVVITYENGQIVTKKTINKF